MADDLRERAALGICAAGLEVDTDDVRCDHPCGLCLKEADAAISACDPIDTATGRTWKERFLERGAWQPISEAKTDGTVYPVWVAPYQGLDGFLTACGYHPDAGWCADELREVTHFIDCPLVAPDKRKGERRVENTIPEYERHTKGHRSGKDRRKAQPETSEVE